MPRVVELCAAEERLETVGWQVDYVVSHCCATRMLDAALARTPYPDGRDKPDALNEWFDMLEDRLTYRRWYFGHYHADAELDERHRLLYRDIAELGSWGTRGSVALLLSGRPREGQCWPQLWTSRARELPR